MNCLHVLDTGRADCSVLFLDTPKGQAVVVIDGGTVSYEGRPVLLDFLEKHHIKTIDLLIITHLHQDHFGGIFPLIGKIKVLRVISPCGNLHFPDIVYSHHQSECFWREYEQIFSYFERSETLLETTTQWVGREINFGCCDLQCLYPVSRSKQPSVEIVEKLMSPTLIIDEMNHLYETFDDKCNRDSSIWLLRCNNTDVALFAGDSTIDTMKLAINNRRVSPEVLKLSHHGVKRHFFNREQVMSISPKVIVVTNNKESKDIIKKDCEELCYETNTQLHYTSDGIFSYSFISAKPNATFR